jgi:hypothetical protein
MLVGHEGKHKTVEIIFVFCVEVTPLKAAAGIFFKD